MGFFDLFKKKLSYMDALNLLMDDSAGMAAWQQALDTISRSNEYFPNLKMLGQLLAIQRGISVTLHTMEKPYPCFIRIVYALEDFGDERPGQREAKSVIQYMVTRWPTFAKETASYAEALANGEDVPFHVEEANVIAGNFYLSKDYYHGWSKESNISLAIEYAKKAKEAYLAYSEFGYEFIDRYIKTM